jgi:glutamyl/glutaminyl-tRNA synthetase
VSFPEEARPFLVDDVVMDEAAARKHLSGDQTREQLRVFREAMERMPSFDRETLEGVLRGVAERAGSKPGPLIHATRVAVTGRAVSPGLFEVLELLGRERTLARLDAALTRW